eukprot:CAMPEP_0114169160 /NCGR_PEP_ID=MMETSP0043_2-20121206/33413_1 /TAXON_ID=464988 /ORGANISM="Hemiselmis andersenii, Strain CCMP644" /LENGTH=46 /DNA_ID= /DNA_START= /DNA_END= /DNA_ORIENTATION=
MTSPGETQPETLKNTKLYLGRRNYIWSVAPTWLSLRGGCTSPPNPV